MNTQRIDCHLEIIIVLFRNSLISTRQILRTHKQSHCPGQVGSTRVGLLQIESTTSSPHPTNTTTPNPTPIQRACGISPLSPLLAFTKHTFYIQNVQDGSPPNHPHRRSPVCWEDCCGTFGQRTLPCSARGPEFSDSVIHIHNQQNNPINNTRQTSSICWSCWIREDVGWI